jgi:hypothetical protein
MSIEPSSKPHIQKADVEAIIAANAIDLKLHPVVLIGIRGYYLDSMGAPGKNGRGVYDDAFCWYSPSVCAAYNGNNDPGAFQKDIASLEEGVWMYKPGLHGFNRSTPPYPAFVQAGDVRVTRDGRKGDFVGDFQIHIHHGGINTVSSLGCQTVPIEQWSSFYSVGHGELIRYNQTKFPYILISEINRRAGVLKAG